jgi:hypothetical protein
MKEIEIDESAALDDVMTGRDCTVTYSEIRITTTHVYGKGINVYRQTSAPSLSRTRRRD